MYEHAYFETFVSNSSSCVSFVSSACYASFGFFTCTYFSHHARTSFRHFRTHDFLSLYVHAIGYACLRLSPCSPSLSGHPPSSLVSILVPWLRDALYLAQHLYMLEPRNPAHEATRPWSLSAGPLSAAELKRGCGGLALSNGLAWWSHQRGTYTNSHARSRQTRGFIHKNAGQHVSWCFHGLAPMVVVHKLCH